MMESLAATGHTAEVFTGTALETREGVDPEAWLARRGFAFEAVGGKSWLVDARGLRPDIPSHYRLTVRAVRLTLYRSANARPYASDAAGAEGILRLFEDTLERF